MFLVGWFYGILASLGLWQEAKIPKILFLGLDNVEKMGLLHMLNDERLVQHQPAEYQLSIGKFKFKALDLGSHQMARRLCNDYYMEVDAVVYMVDASDLDRLMDSTSGCNNLLCDVSFADVPILILGNINMIDIPGAVDKDLIYRLVFPYYARHRRPIEIFMCSILQKKRFGDGFKWLLHYIN